jgi:WD40 repeat protein
MAPGRARARFAPFVFAAWVALLLMACSDAPAPAASNALAATTPVQRFRDGALPARQLAFSPDAQWLATTNADGTVHLRRAADRRIVRTFRHAHGATSVAFAPDGRWLVTGGYDGSVRTWDVRTGNAIAVFAGHVGTVWAVDVSPDGLQVVSAGEDKLVRVWRTADAKPLAALAGHALNLWSVRFSPDGQRIASGGFDHVVKLWDARTFRLVRTLRGHTQAVVSVDFSPDGRWLASGGDDSTIRLWNTADGSLVRTLANGNHVYAVSFSPDSRWLATGGRARGGFGTFVHGLTGWGGEREAIGLWRIADGALLQRLAFADDVMSVAISPDHRWLAGAGEDGVAAVWRVGAHEVPIE